MDPSKPSLEAGTLPVSIEGGPRVLTEILRGGQSFLWEEVSPNSWRGVIDLLPFRVRLSSDHHIEWSCPTDSNGQAHRIIEQYFAVETDFTRIEDELPWRSDPVLAEAMQGFRGLRILRQPPGVALLSFLLSPLKRIEQIRAGLLEIARRWGTRLDNDLDAPPSWKSLAEVSEQDLRQCGIGYRARSIHQTAQFLKDRPTYLTDLQTLSTEEARDRLIALPGVGRKIADCVLLFGYGRLEAFPIDTWISRYVKESYALEGFTDAQVQQFAKAHYGQFAGVAQQFLFAKARSG